MQMKVIKGNIRLSRYAGSEEVERMRRSHFARVGEFPADVRPIFAGRENPDESGLIPYAIYRATTIDEHEEIIEFVRKLHCEKVHERLARVTKEIAELTTDIGNVTLTDDECRKFLAATQSAGKAVRKSTKRTSALAPQILPTTSGPKSTQDLAIVEDVAFAV